MSAKPSELVLDLERMEQRREPASSEVARRLVGYLLSGSLRPGDRLPSERQLAAALGVGRSVLREALKSLTLLGLVEVRLGDGTYLKRADSDLLPQVIEWGLLLGAKRTKDLVEARRHIEIVVAGLAAERRDADAVDRLRGQLEAMRSATGDADRFVAADIGFHVCLAETARNDTLEQIVASVRSLLTVWISRVMHAAHSFEPTLAEHAAIFEAVDAGDPIAARAAMEQHMLGATRRLEATLVDEDAGAPERDGSVHAVDDVG
jgi:GntR family transcriptional regulator, transcriptional repressor for pyruvate dehydrogenase complex